MRSEREIAAAVLASCGQPGEISWRSWRWAVAFQNEFIAFAADDDEGWERLRRERALLDRLAARTSVALPAVVLEDERTRLQLRRMVPGVTGDMVERIVFGRDDKVGPATRYQPNLPFTAKGRRLARDLGHALSALQRAIPVEEARALGFAVHSYLFLLDQVAAYLAEQRELRDLYIAIAPLRRWFAELPNEPALCLCDLQLHNIAVLPQTGALGGLFDFDDAGIMHQLEDFKYLPSFGLEFTEFALEAFMESGGRSSTLAEVGRFHVLSAMEHFLFVPEETPRWPEIVRWARAAVHHFARDW
ncbi:aminoglycoside phosphotransferase family protein [Pendulispora brunnea]|uniref:Aminoglycoside phosphotransferase family protein n=1 Tax=Pendulispora brunnea TaxID=2905690 RepID=A0ABZ2JUM3_9BACT